MNALFAPWRLEYISRAEESAGCIFCTLPREDGRDRENLIVHRAKHCFHILNRFPYASGHLMVVPYAHVDDLAQLDTEAFAELHLELLHAQQVMREAFSPHGMNVGMNLGRAAGAGIADHVHYHVVPRWNGDTNFMPVLADVKMIPEHLLATHDRLRQKYTR